MRSECVLDPEYNCVKCGECDLCDLDRRVECENCLTCVLGEEKSRYISIDEVKKADEDVEDG